MCMCGVHVWCVCVVGISAMGVCGAGHRGSGASPTVVVTPHA